MEITVKDIRCLKPWIIVPIVVVIFALTDYQVFGFGFLPRLTTRFCYNSPNPTTVNSQCVLCNYYLFDSTLLGCTGSSALTINITAAQAFCVISNCLGQLKQQPVFLGRKKRSEPSHMAIVEDNSIKNHFEKHDNNAINILSNKFNSLQEDSSSNDTRLIFKFKNDDEHFIVAKEVEALIIDLPETIDETVFAAG